MEEDWTLCYDTRYFARVEGKEEEFVEVMIVDDETNKTFYDCANNQFITCDLIYVNPCLLPRALATDRDDEVYLEHLKGAVFRETFRTNLAFRSNIECLPIAPMGISFLLPEHRLYVCFEKDRELMASAQLEAFRGAYLKRSRELALLRRKEHERREEECERANREGRIVYVGKKSEKKEQRPPPVQREGPTDPRLLRLQTFADEWEKERAEEKEKEEGRKKEEKKVDGKEKVVERCKARPTPHDWPQYRKMLKVVFEYVEMAATMGYTTFTYQLQRAHESDIPTVALTTTKLNGEDLGEFFVTSLMLCDCFYSCDAFFTIVTGEEVQGSCCSLARLEYLWNRNGQ